MITTHENEILVCCSQGDGVVNTRRGRWSPIQLVCIVVFGALGVVMGVGAVMSALDSETLRHHGVQADATAMADSDQAKGSYCDVQFADIGGKVWNEHVGSSCGVPIGHKVPVVYDPLDPSDIDFPQNLGAGHILATSALLVTFGLLCAAVSVWALRVSRERFSDVNRRLPRWRAPGHRPTSHRRDR
jgi:hypothetical protein